VKRRPAVCIGSIDVRAGLKDKICREGCRSFCGKEEGGGGPSALNVWIGACGKERGDTVAVARGGCEVERGASKTVYDVERYALVCEGGKEV
jgi:hypothetical protein